VERYAAPIVRLRFAIVAVWLVVVVVAGVASTGLSKLLSNRFDQPGTDSSKVLAEQRRLFGERGDSGVLVVVRTRDGRPPSAAQRAAAAVVARRVAATIPHSRPGPPQVARDLVYVPVATTLDPVGVGRHADAAVAAAGSVPGAEVYVTGNAVINHELQPVFDSDLQRGELVAGAVAVVVLFFIFGTLLAPLVPVLLALATVPTALGVVWVIAHFMDMAIYITNLVSLIGIGIAIDYSLLVVYRFREEMLRLQEPRAVPGEDPRRVPLAPADLAAALAPTLRYAIHAVVFSGLTVAVGLAGLILLPLPFIRSMGVGGLIVPLVSILAAVTLLPALLAIFGTRLARYRVVPRRVLDVRANPELGAWARLSRAVMRRPAVFLAVGGIALVALAVPTVGLQLTPGSSAALPTSLQSVRGLRALQGAVGAGTLSPSTILIDGGRAGAALSPANLAATRRLAAALARDPEVAPATVHAPTQVVTPGLPLGLALARTRGLFTDASGRYARVDAGSRDEYGSLRAQDLARRIRRTLVPQAGFPAGTTVLVGGGPAAGVDFIDRSYAAFPYLIAGVLVVTVLLLARAFRSLLLPLKAVVLNLLAVGAAYGVLVLVFRDGLGTVIGLHRTPQVEAWIPIFLFATLFGLSMDYEVFLVSRMREEWDRGSGNAAAVTIGLQRTGRIVTAAAIIMVAAFSGFVLGNLVGLQQFGLGLAVAVLLDATVIRVLLVPSFMAIAGRWNWYLPARAARLLRVAPSDVRARGATPAD
jgi:RND superfamily putative drug exporter